MKRLVITFIICLCATLLVRGQAPLDTAPDRPRVMPPPERPVRTSARNVPSGPRLIWVNEFEPNSSEKRLLMVDPQDQQRFGATLSQPDTGLVRLLPFYPRSRVVSVDSPEAYRRPGFTNFASTYSFSKKKHGHALNGWRHNPNLGWAELRLKDGILSTGIMEESFGLMVRLGDVLLENVTAETPGLDELANYIPPDNYSAAKVMFENSLRGIRVRQFLYSSRIPANVNTTYALRSVLNRRADLLVCFRVVRQDADGSVTILWKKLKDYPKPSWKKKK